MSGGSWILVIDDDPDIREIVTLALEERGHRVVDCADGAAALELLHREPGCSLVILDLMMPTLSGWEFRERQLEDPELAHIPVVVVSGSRGVAEHANHLGAAAWLAKPFELAQLTDAIARHALKGSDEEARRRRDAPTPESVR